MPDGWIDKTAENWGEIRGAVVLWKTAQYCTLIVHNIGQVEAREK